MAQFASDTFTGTAGTELSAYNAAWTKHPSYTENYLVTAAGRISRNGPGTGGYYHSGTPASADYSVSADLFSKELDAGSAFVGVTGRMSTSANTFYLARYGGGITDGWQLFKFVAGVATTLGSSAQSFPDETSYQIKLKMVGSTIELFKQGEGTALFSVTDTSITAAGKAGIRGLGEESDTTGLNIDNFSADDIGGGAVTHATTGALAGTGGAVSGTAAHLAVHGTTGALAGDGGAIAGSAARTRAHPTTGVLAGTGGAVSGAADHVAPGGTHDTSGALSGAGGAVAGTAAHIAVHGTSGALAGDGGSVSGTAAHVVVHGTSGVLAGAGGAVDGTAARVAAAVTHDTSGALSGAGGAVSGDARGPDADGGGMGFSMSRMRRLVKIKFNGKLYQALEDQIPELLETLEEQAQQKVAKKRNAKSKPAPVATVVSAPADVLPSLQSRIADVNRAIGDLWRVDEDEDEEILWLIL